MKRIVKRKIAILAALAAVALIFGTTRRFVEAASPARPAPSGYITIGGERADFEGTVHILGVPGDKELKHCGSMYKDIPVARAECTVSGPSYYWQVSSANSSARVRPLESATTAFTMTLGGALPESATLHLKIWWVETGPKGAAPRGMIFANVPPLTVYFDIVQLYSVSFTGGYTLKAQDSEFASDGSTNVRDPQYLIHMKSTALCYKEKASPGMIATLNVPAGVSATDAIISAEATEGARGPTLSYSGNVVLVAGVVQANLSTTDHLGSTIDNANLMISWKISYGGHKGSLAGTSNPLFVVAGPSAGPSATVKRMNYVTGIAKGATDADDAAEKIGPVATAYALLGRRTSVGDTPSLTTAWQALEDHGDCGTLSTLMKYELELIGYPGAEVHYVYPCHKSWAALVDAGPETDDGR